MNVGKTLRRVIGLAAALGAASLSTLCLPGTAQAHQPAVSGAAKCDARTGDWVVTWKIVNSEHDLAGTVDKVTVTPDGGSFSGVKAGDSLPVAHEHLTATQTVAAGAKEASLGVTVTWNRPTFTVTREAAATVKLGGACEKPRSARPSTKFVSTCDGSVEVNLVNPDDATAAAAFEVTAKKGFARSVSVEPGDAEQVTVPPGYGAKITVAVAGRTVGTGEFEQPTSCGPELPKTGVSLPTIAGGGLALITVGAVIMYGIRPRASRHGQV